MVRVSEWDDRLTSSPGVVAIFQLEALAAELPEDPAVESASQASRLRRTVRYAANRIRQTDAELVTLQAIDRLGVSGAAALAATNAYVQAPDAALLAQANESMDRVLDDIALWPVATGKADLKMALSEHRKSMEHVVRAVTEQAAAAQSELNTLDNALKAFETVTGDVVAKAQIAVEEAATRATTAIETSATNAQETIVIGVTGVEARLAVADTTINSQKGRLDTAISTFQQQFSDEQTARSTSFNEAYAKATTDLADALRQQQETSEAAATARMAEGDRLIGELTTHESRARALVSKTGSEAVSGGYVRHANGERLAAWVWAIGAVITIVLALAYGLWALHGEAVPIGDWQWLAARLLIFVPLAVGFAFSVQQSGLHRKREVKARRYELAFEALEPYAALLPDAERYGLRVELARKAFFAPDKDDEDEETGLIKDVIDQAFDLAKTAVKR